MRAKRFRAGATAGVVAVAFLGGCAAQQIKRLEPELELRAAAQYLAGAQRAGFTVKLTGRADDLIAGLRKESPDPDDVTALRTLFGSTVTIAYDKAGDGADDDRALLAATVDGVAGAEIRVVGRTLYAKAPVAELARKFGAADGDVDDLRRDATAGAPGAGAFFDGRWISVDLTEAGGAAGLPTSQADATKAMTALRTGATNLVDGAAIVRDAADPRHLTVTSSTTKAYAEVKRIVTEVAGEQLDGIADEIGEAPKDRPIVLDLWVDDEKLTAVEVNLLQFVDGATGRVALRVEMTTGAEINAPENPTKIDTTGLGGVLTGPDEILADLGDDPVGAAEMLGYQAQAMAAAGNGKPADHLKAAIAELDGPAVQAEIVRRGVAEVTAGRDRACLRVPGSIEKDPVVTAGRC